MGSSEGIPEDNPKTTMAYSTMATTCRGYACYGRTYQVRCLAPSAFCEVIAEVCGYRLTMATLTMGAFLEVLLDAHALVTTLTTLTTPYYTCYAYYLAALTTDPTRCRTPTRP